MLLNYLYSNFLEERAFADACQSSSKALGILVQARVFPAPSYEYTSNGQSVSFVSDFTDCDTYRFHLKGHTAWFDVITRLGLHTEERARRHFFSRYNEAKVTFLTSDLGRQLVEAAPDVGEQFDVEHADATWGHFLNGVYGVCTRDGQPESVFLKQAGVMFIEKMTAAGPGSLTPAQTQLLKRAVTLLDAVESDFAPHEAPQASRQRCIVDVRADFSLNVAA